MQPLFSVTAFPDMQFYARDGRSSGSLESKNRSMSLASNRKAREAGMYANVSIPLMRQDSTLFVPVSSVGKHQRKSVCNPYGMDRRNGYPSEKELWQ